MEGSTLDLGEMPEASTTTLQSMRSSGHSLEQQQRPQRQQRQQQKKQQPKKQQQKKQQQKNQQQLRQLRKRSAASLFEPDPLQSASASQKSKVIPRQRAPEIAIAPFQRSLEAAPAVASPSMEGRIRVSHACEPCRRRKRKCSGERPSCQNCEDNKIFCVYGDRKRDKSRRAVRAMVKRLQEYERVFHGLILRVEENDQRLIHKVLEPDIPPDDETLLSSSSRSEGDEGRPGLSRVGSTRSLGHVNEDFNRTAATRATGFMGKNSELTWMQRLKQEADVSSGSGEDALLMSDAVSFQETLRHPINESTYHCDDISMLVLDHVEPYHVPPRQTADLLFEHYLDTVHPAFPIIGKITFLDQYRTYYSENVESDANWLAILNLIFAIGAKYSRLIQADWGGKVGDDLIYFTRARLLGCNTDSILDHASLQSVQVAGLMAFYLSAINQINRAWTFSGIAMRHACSLGLNLQNNSKSISEPSMEIRHRVWWAVCSVDFRLAVMTGRPSAFLSANSTVPLPRAIEEESFFLFRNPTFQNREVQLHPRYATQETQYVNDAPPNQSSSSPTTIYASPTETLGPTFPQTPVPASHAMYFLLQTKLSLVTNEVLDQLYRPKRVTSSWAHVQLVISALTGKLDEWRKGLPYIFDFSQRHRDQQFSRQRMCLGFFCHSTAMIIFRPCLCRMNRALPNASGKSKEFDRMTAANCVRAAKAMLNLLPDEPNPVGLYSVAPWWCLVHHLVQASTISMLELSFQADHMPEEVDEIIRSATKAVQWLRSMAKEDLAANRAWRLCEDMLHKVASRVTKPFTGFPDRSWSGGGGGSLFDHPYITSAAGAEGAATMRGNFGPVHATEESGQQRPFHGGSPLQAHIYTSYDEIFPPVHPPTLTTGPESSFNGPSRHPGPGQVKGHLSGDVEDLNMTRYNQGQS